MAITLDDINREYLKYHVAKEDLFWSTYMGTEKDPGALERAEAEFTGYLSDPQRLKEVRSALERWRQESGDAATGEALRGWQALFETHTMESESARRLQKELIELETALFQKRAKVELKYRDEKGQEQVASTNVLASLIAAAPQESVRRSAHEALLSLEKWVLDNGFLDIVKKRNELARALGHRNYFEYKVRKNERMTVEELFSILDDFERRTRQTCFGNLRELARRSGESALEGHNLKFAVAGDAERRLDPYFPFQKSLEVWCRSFSRLGIRFRGATLQLDLFDRKGKYENGFMHGPQPCYYDNGKWHPARINFTSNATPNQVGSGRDGVVTLFHEGGHAAHFSNITMNAPCFSQEFPPTSMAYAETQSMFCDSLVSDPDWLWEYARTLEGDRISEDLLRLFVTSGHPFSAFRERSILVVPVFERRLYEMKEDELEPDRVLRLTRECEREVLGIPCSPRPLLAVPHLLAGDSSCAYHGYLLAHMAVYQTRAFLISRHGYLSDNPRVGEELSRHYWAPGNSRTHSETIRSMTAEGLSGRELAAHCNLTVDELWEVCLEKLRAARERVPASGEPELDARIRIVHGTESIADSEESLPAMWRDFEAWIERNYRFD